MHRRNLFAATVLTALSLSVACAADTADEHLARAKTYNETAKLSEAILEYRAALQIDQKRGDIRLLLADALIRNRDYAGALREYVRAADVLPSDAAAQVKAGQMLLMAGKFEDAKTRANAALTLDQKSSDAMILLGNALAGLKDLDAAVAEYQEVIALDPAKEAPYLNLGAVQFARGQKDAAEATFRQAVAAAPRSVSVRTALASFLWSTGRAQEAESTLKEALAIEPDHFAANRSLGVFYLATGRALEAEPYFKRIADTAKTTGATVSLADYYITVNRPDEAKRLLKELASQPDAFAPATLRLASLEAAQNNRAEALLRVREVTARNPKDMSARLLESRVLLLDGKRDESLVLATSIFKEEPTSPSAAGAYMVVGAIETARERNDEAIKAYEEALRLERQPVGAQLALAGLQLSMGAIDKAATYVQQALSAAPKNPLGRSLQVRIHLVKGEGQKAAATLAALQKDYPNSVPVLNLVGARHAIERRYDLARAAYSKALETAPNDMEALAGLVAVDIETRRPAEAVGRVESAMRRQAPNSSLLLLAARTHAAIGDSAKAEAVLKQCIDLDPNRISAYALLGELYGRQNRLADAKEQFAKVVEKTPRSVGANTMLGMLLEGMKDLGAAEQQYLKTLDIDANAAVAANNLAWLYGSSNRNLDQALELAQRAYRQLPDQPNVNDTLGWIYFLKGLYPQAIRHLEASVKQAPGDPVGHYHLGMAYERSGEVDKARAALRASVRLGNFDKADDAKRALARLGGD